MEFSQNYFEGEERDGFYISSMMKKVWAAQIELLEEIKAVCKKYDIQFFAAYGTLIGAVRHNGYIPWDDDMDIFMKRKDYNKFLSVANELPTGCRIINAYTEPEFEELLSRVVNNSCISFEHEHLKKYHGCPYVIGIDIFPLDYMSSDANEDAMICQLLNIVLGKAGEIDKDMMSGEEKEWLLDQIEKLTGAQIHRNGNIQNQLLLLGDKLCAMIAEEEAEEITIMIKKLKKTHLHMKKECFAESIEMPFENTTIPVPVGYDTFLRLNYGENYMIPIKKRGDHDYPFYKDQEQIVKEKLGFIPE